MVWSFRIESDCGRDVAGDGSTRSREGSGIVREHVLIRRSRPAGAATRREGWGLGGARPCAGGSGTRGAYLEPRAGPRDEERLRRAVGQSLNLHLLRALAVDQR